MLYFSRWKALAIILTALVVCLCAVPNFFPEATVKTWPSMVRLPLVRVVTGPTAFTSSLQPATVTVRAMAELATQVEPSQVNSAPAATTLVLAATGVASEAVTLASANATPAKDRERTAAAVSIRIFMGSPSGVFGVVIGRSGLD
eukprot:gene13110-biopygen11113